MCPPPEWACGATSVVNQTESEISMLKKTVAGAALIAATVGLSGATAYAATAPGAPALKAQAETRAAQPVYYRYRRLLYGRSYGWG